MRRGAATTKTPTTKSRGVPQAWPTARRSEEHTSELQSPDHLGGRRIIRSEEHTSELQSPDHLVCRLLLEKKKIRRGVVVRWVRRVGGCRARRRRLYGKRWRSRSLATLLFGLQFAVHLGLEHLIFIKYHNYTHPGEYLDVRGDS